MADKRTISSRLNFCTDKLITVPGVLVIVEIILGVIVLSLTSYYNPSVEGFFASSEQTFLLMVSFTFLVMSLLIFIASIIDMSCDEKSTFLPLYLLLAFILYISASIALLAYISTSTKYIKIYGSYDLTTSKVYGYHGLLTAGILGFFNSACYLASLVCSVRVYMKSLRAVLP